MFEKLKKWFDPQKGDEAFVEAATNVSARQEHIDKLVAARTKVLRAFFLIIPLHMGVFLITLFAPAPPAALKSQIFSVSGQIMMIMILVISHAIIDLQIKFLKALEAGAQQPVRADN